MIYMVDHVFTDAAAEPAWHAWYAAYLRKLVAVPGLHTAQRFRAIGSGPPRYLAMYSIDTLDVYSSDAYRNMGGGGSQSAQFHRAYALWTRNVFEGAERAPLVDETQRVLVWDAVEPVSEGLPPGTAWLRSVGLHMTTPYRAFAVLEQDSPRYDVSGARLYEPFTAPVLAQPPEE